MVLGWDPVGGRLGSGRESSGVSDESIRTNPPNRTGESSLRDGRRKFSGIKGRFTLKRRVKFYGYYSR